jgi:PAS domain S-box-containing protein
LGVGFAAAYWIAHSAAQAFIFQHGSLLNQCFSRDTSEVTGRLLAVLFLVSLGLIGGMRRGGRFAASSNSSPSAAGHRWSDSAVRTVEETQERYRTLVENIDIGISLIDTDYNIQMTNRALGELLHKPVCEFVGKRCYAEFEKRPEVCPHCPGAVAMRTGRPAEVETIGTRDDGARFPVRVRAFPMKTPDGAVTGFIEVVQDITDRKQAEEALRAGERRYRTLFEDLPVGVYRTTPDGRILEANPALVEMLGYDTFEELAARNLDEGGFAFPHSREQFRMRVHRGSAIESEEAIWERRDKTPIFVREHARVVRDADGQVLCYEGVVKDVTKQRQAQEALRQSEERFRTLCQSAPIGIFVTDQAGDCTYANNRLQEIAGLTLGESLGMQWTRLIHPEDREEALAAVAETIQTGDEFVREFRIVTPKGETKHLAVRATWLRAADGRPLGQVGAIEDVTERRRVEQALREREAIFRTLAETVNTAISIVQDGIVKYVNPYACRLGGYEAEEMIGKAPWEFVHPEMREAIRQRALGRQQGSPEPMQYDLRVVGRDGRDIWVTQSVSFTEYEGRPAVLASAMDMTERKESERALRESETKHRTLVEQLPAIIYTAALDAVSATTYISPQVERILGFSPSSFVSNPDGWRERIHPEDRERVLSEVARSHEEDKPLVCEYRMTAADGHIVWFRDSAEVVRDENGRRLFLQGVMLDITDVKRTEEELRKFKTICDRAPHGYAVIDLDGYCLYLNDAWAKMHGSTREELLGRHVSAFHTQEQMPLVERLNKGLERAGSFVNEEVWHKRRDGTVFPTLMDAVVVNDDQGRPLFLSGMAVDITERKEIEAVLRRQALVFENINDGVIITDREGRVTDWNPGAERIFDHFKQEIIGKSPEVLNRPEDARSITERIRAGIQRDGYWSDEVCFVRKDGSEGICEAFLVPLRNEKGDWIGTVAVNRDVTARKLAEEEKTRLEAQLHQMQKMDAVGTLASGIAHDFNNLLTAIFGYAALARDSLPVEHAARRSLEMIEQAGKQARGVISSLLTFSRNTVPRRSPINLVHSLTETEQLLRRLLPAVIEFEKEMPAEADLWVNGDAAQLQQVWINLAVNARDAMPEGGRLRIALSKDDSAKTDSGSTAVVVIEDTGSGMSAEVRGRAFEPFFTTKPRGQGTGLGLAVSHEIVAQHEGTIKIDSEEGHSTRVTVSLPCCPRPEIVPDASAAPAARAGQGETVVVVEDDEHVRAILVSALRSQGYDVLFAADGDGAMSVFDHRGQDIRLVVLDLDLPKASGAGILRRTLDSLPGALVLVVTGRIDWNPAEDADGRQFVLRKPFTILELGERVARLVRETRARRAGLESA